MAGRNMPFRVSELDAHARGARRRHQVRIDARDRAGEMPLREPTEQNGGDLAFAQLCDIALGEFREHPHDGVVDDAEQRCTRRRPHSIRDVALHDIPSRGALHVIEIGLSRALDLRDHLVRDGEVFEASPSTFVTDRGKVLRGRGADVGRVEAEQRLALADVVAGRDVLHLLDEGIRPHGNHGDAALVLLDSARRAHGVGEDTMLSLLEPHPGPLQLPRRNGDCRSAVVLALEYGDVVHPHRVLLRDREASGRPIGLR